MKYHNPKGLSDPSTVDVNDSRNPVARKKNHVGIFTKTKRIIPCRTIPLNYNFQYFQNRPCRTLEKGMKYHSPKGLLDPSTVKKTVNETLWQEKIWRILIWRIDIWGKICSFFFLAPFCMMDNDGIAIL